MHFFLSRLKKIIILFQLLLLLSFTQVHAQAPLVDDLGYKGGSIAGIKKNTECTAFYCDGRLGEKRRKLPEKSCSRNG